DLAHATTMTDRAPAVMKASYQIGLPASRKISALRHARREQLVAGLDAAPAGLGADAAVDVVLGVPVALLRAEVAGPQAGADDALRQLPVRTRLACEDPPGGVAGIGAVEVPPDAEGQVSDVGLGQIGVGTGGAGDGADQALLDAAGQRRVGACPR